MENSLPLITDLCHLDEPLLGGGGVGDGFLGGEGLGGDDEQEEKATQ